MSNIIDSLKRLERIGDENSKTTQKLIEAARDIADKIVKQFAVRDSEVVDLGAPSKLERAAGGYTTTREIHKFAHYAIRESQLTFADRRGDNYVALDRENALQFSKDLANGLLDYLAEILAERLKEAGSGLAAIEDALSKIQS